MTHACWHFALTSIETGRLLALSAICPDALRRPAPEAPRRRLASAPTVWRNA